MKNKKNFLFLSLAFCLSACSHVISVEKVNVPMNFSSGNCWVSSRLKTNQKSGFIFKKIDNQYVTIKDSIAIDSLKLNDDNFIRIKYKEERYRLATHMKVDWFCVDDGRKIDDFFAICREYTPAEFLGILKSDLDSLKSLNQKYFYFKKQVLKDTSYIVKQNFSAKPIFLKGRQFHKNGDWSDFKEPQCPSCRGLGTTTARQIEYMLNLLGYETNEDNVLDKKERKQLHDFQRKNHLKVGKFNDETDNKLRDLVSKKLLQ